MNYKRHNSQGARRRKDRYTGWGGKKSFKIDFAERQFFKKNKYSVLKGATSHNNPT
jgi:hypothetical protein